MKMKIFWLSDFKREPEIVDVDENQWSYDILGNIARDNYNRYKEIEHIRFHYFDGWVSGRIHNKRVKERLSTEITTIGFTDCKFCNYKPNIDGHDACIGELKGVKNACCGHGRSNLAYVQFDHEFYKIDPNKKIIEGNDALEYIKNNRNI